MEKEEIRIDIVTAFPSMFEAVLNASIIRIAQKKEIAKIVLHNLHDYVDNTFKHIDDAPFGGGAGMIIQCQPIFSCIETLKSQREYDEIIFLSADGELLNQSIANELSLKKNIILLCGHYKGIDQRVRDVLITREISIGSFVLSGGELPAMVLIDSIVRLIPGVLGDAESALEDSFQNDMLEAPYYTRPADFRGLKVPDVLLCGDPKLIQKWKDEKSYEKTTQRRPDLLK